MACASKMSVLFEGLDKPHPAKAVAACRRPPLANRVDPRLSAQVPDAEETGAPYPGHPPSEV